MTTLRALFAAGLVAATFGIAVAKLPPAPPMDEKAKAAKAAAATRALCASSKPSRNTAAIEIAAVAVVSHTPSCSPN